jgi:tryptophanyl-tRNA synthetase
MSAKPRIFSGMQPTGELHVGNYFGALKQWVALSRDPAFEVIYCIVDAHAVTVDYEPREMPERIFETAVSYLAAGVEPERAILFVQSDVPAHAELAWYLSTVTAMGDLHRMTQFKEKSDEHKQNVNAGLFTYPVLMAADILLYKASVVPVGNDQVQHLELCREIARRFNARYGEVFPEPAPRLSPTPRIMGLDGKSKMSKSRGNAISLMDPPELVEKKLKTAFTDPQKLRRGDPGRPEICNVFTMHTALSDPARIAEVEAGCRSGALGCGDCKKLLADALNAELRPFQEKVRELRADRGRVIEILNDGGARARQIAEQTMSEVRQVMGVGAGRTA